MPESLVWSGCIREFRGMIFSVDHVSINPSFGPFVLRLDVGHQVDGPHWFKTLLLGDNPVTFALISRALAGPSVATTLPLPAGAKAI